MGESTNYINFGCLIARFDLPDGTSIHAYPSCIPTIVWFTPFTTNCMCLNSNAIGQPHKKWNFSQVFTVFFPWFHLIPIIFSTFSPGHPDVFRVFPRFPNRGPSFQVHPAVAAHDQNVLAQHSGGRREARRGQLRARKPALGTPGGSGTSYPAWSTFT